ncbi:vacuolar protein sorting-associated protein 54 [Achaetomium macrosporum]|uniref:Vacuolar protein sorting-associated protein 54 n=1 Tax=Achaetomium macrosporum TaxID=79813 RepID=A0AAN7C9Q0_9PEZI|nr:vacuolar protein sorting-associated protein 54 [Achaetomium macrosporum]
MFSNQGARKSVDSLSSTLSAGHRGDFPFHGAAPQGPQRPHQRRGSSVSSIHSIGGSLDAGGSLSNTLFESGQNAISTLLQPPIVRTGLLPHTAPPASSAHKPPTARDIPPVALTNIPHVETSEFKPYLSQVGALYEQLRRIQADEDQGLSNLHRRSTKADEYPEALDEGHLRPGKRPGLSSRRTSTASLSSLSSIEAVPTTHRSSSRPKRGQAHGPPPLSTIPAVYFDEDFHLENPRTFDVVSERSEVVRPAPGSDEKTSSNGQATAPRKALATNAILQEKLSWYMDTVEMHLIQSISTASTTFFTALGSLRELHSEAAESVERIKALRKELDALDEEIATGGLHLVQQRRRRENVKQLHDAVMQLREIVDGVAVCESLVDVGEVSDALDNIDSLEKLIAGEPSEANPLDIQLRDLRGATVLQGVSNDLDTLRLRIGKSYETRFLNTLLTDLRNHVERVSTQEVLMRWSSASARVRGAHSREPSAFPSYMAGTDQLRTELLSSLTGLHRARYLTAAATAYREAALREIRSIIRQQMPSSNDDDNESLMSTSTRTGGQQRSQQERSIILARNLRALEPQEAEELMTKMYIGVAEALRRLSTQVKVLLDVASSIGESSVHSGVRSPLRSPPFSPAPGQTTGAAQEAQEEIHRAVDIANLLGQAVDVAHEKIVKVLRVRSEQSKRLDLVWFLRYFTLNLHFANECEAVSGRSGTTLKTVVNSHIKDFIQNHGDAENQKLAQGMESDQWNAADFSDKDTELLNQILEGSTRDAAAWMEGTQIWIPHPDTEKSGAEPDVLSAQTNGSGKTKTRSAVVDSESFLLPNSAILCMHGMARFLHLMAAIPSMTAEISASLIAYLQLFNSRCTQLILGTGATRSAGLRNITTKHLALASQSLAFIAAIIPHVREFVRRHCGSGTAVSTVMGEFDKVRRAFQEHQNNIYDKLLEIMSGRALAGTKKLKALNWEEEASNAAANEYMEILAKETTILHRNLTKHLPESTVRMIMLPVFKNYKDTFGAAYQGVELKTEQGRERMLRDVEFFQSRLGKIDGFDDAGKYLVNVIKSKQISAPAPPPPAPQPASSTTTTTTPSPSTSPSPPAPATSGGEDEKTSAEWPTGPRPREGAAQAEENGESKDAGTA